MSNPSARSADLFLDEAHNLQASIERLRHALKVQRRQFQAWERLVAPGADNQIAAERLAHLRRVGAL